MGFPLQVTVTLEPKECPSCGTVFGVVSAVYQRYKNNGQAIRCTNPKCAWDSMVIQETEAMRLQKKLDSEVQARRWVEQSLAAEKNSHAATKGTLTKIRKRVHNGVCPCCNRTFANLARHMKTKHPDVTP